MCTDSIPTPTLAIPKVFEKWKKNFTLRNRVTNGLRNLFILSTQPLFLSNCLYLPELGPSLRQARLSASARPNRPNSWITTSSSSPKIESFYFSFPFSLSLYFLFPRVDEVDLIGGGFFFKLFRGLHHKLWTTTAATAVVWSVLLQEPFSTLVNERRRTDPYDEGSRMPICS